MLSTSSFADACSMTKVINAGVTSLTDLESLTPVAGSGTLQSLPRCRHLHSWLCLSQYAHSLHSTDVPAACAALANQMNWPLTLSRLLQVSCTSRGTALALTLQLHWRPITVSFAGTSSNRGVRALQLLGLLVAQSAIY